MYHQHHRDLARLRHAELIAEAERQRLLRSVRPRPRSNLVRSRLLKRLRGAQPASAPGDVVRVVPPVRLAD